VKAIVVYSALLMTGIANAATDPPSPDVAQFAVSAVIESNADTSAPVSFPVVPAGKRLVIQSMTWYRVSAATGSVGDCFITFKVDGVSALVSLPELVSQGQQAFGSTLSATYYANAGTAPSVSTSRTGSSTEQETDRIFITGYYVTP
jgi:hypothetical protein